MKTRAKKPAASKTATTAPPAAGSQPTLSSSESDPPKLFVLPDDASPESRFLTLPHPATSRPTRYFLDPARGFYEFTRVSAPRKTCRSVLLVAGVEERRQNIGREQTCEENDERRKEEGKGEEGQEGEEEGYVLQSPDLFIATPIDCLFTLIPALWPTGNLDHQEEWSTFHDKLFSNNDEDVRYKHLRSIFRSGSEAGKALEQRMEARMRSVCDTIEMGDETSYKLSMKKFAGVVYEKAERMVAAGLPPSMEEHFIRRVLEVPERSIMTDDSVPLVLDEFPDPASGGLPTVAATQRTDSKTAQLVHLLRLRTALNYLTTTLLPASLIRCLLAHFESGLMDFAPLTAHLANVARLKAEAHALRSISDNISRKRGTLDDEEALGRAEVKKRKKEEEEIKKKGMSAGVKRLGKVDVGGMKRLQTTSTNQKIDINGPVPPATMPAPSQEKLYLSIDYGDTYLQPLLLAALTARLPPDLLVFLTPSSPAPPPDSKYLQWRQYEDIDFERLLAKPRTCLANSYVIRKALIRKHYLADVVAHWVAKWPGSVLERCVKGGVEFEVDYAEFLDEALVEGWELKESWARNEGLEGREREWWILKPGMSERGEGVRLFSSEEELRAIFEEWDPLSDDDAEDEAEDEESAAHSGDENHVPKSQPQPLLSSPNGKPNGIITSQLRHFIAQPYIHPPLLLPAPHPLATRKFHLRTYVLASGALQVYVYRRILALFAAETYQAPTVGNSAELGRHLTNTCLQDSGEREGSVREFWGLPDTIPSLSPNPQDGSEGEGEAGQTDWREHVFSEICAITSATFEAAARVSSTHFQVLPNSFEIFGVDFLVDGEGGVWLLEVNAFPDFGQTGEELRGVVRGLVEGVVEVGVMPFFGLGGRQEGGEMVKVLDIDLGRR
ncbi:hypothetical protein LTR73_007406 [Friedmanniomyces endolithicus]|nr:hypothetical protein LTR73_007406 [Friedmanniomyces endolithicus]